MIYTLTNSLLVVFYFFCSSMWTKYVPLLGRWCTIRSVVKHFCPSTRSYIRFWFLCHCRSRHGTCRECWRPVWWKYVSNAWRALWCCDRPSGCGKRTRHRHLLHPVTDFRNSTRRWRDMYLYYQCYSPRHTEIDEQKCRDWCQRKCKCCRDGGYIQRHSLAASCISLRFLCAKCYKLRVSFFFVIHSQYAPCGGR